MLKFDTIPARAENVHRAESFQNYADYPYEDEPAVKIGRDDFNYSFGRIVGDLLIENMVSDVDEIIKAAEGLATEVPPLTFTGKRNFFRGVEAALEAQGALHV